MVSGLTTKVKILVVCLPLNPGSGGQGTQGQFTTLVIDKDEQGEGEGGQPPRELERVHPQTLVHAGCVRQERRQAGLKEQAKVHEVVLHALLEDGQTSGLADDQISPLHDDNRHKEGGVAGEL